MIGYFYEEKDGKVDKLKEVAKDLIGLVGVVTDNGQNSGVYNVDKVTLRKLHSKQKFAQKFIK